MKIIGVEKVELCEMEIDGLSHPVLRHQDGRWEEIQGAGMSNWEEILEACYRDWIEENGGTESN